MTTVTTPPDSGDDDTDGELLLPVEAWLAHWASMTLAEVVHEVLEWVSRGRPP